MPRSAGILLYRHGIDGLEVLIAHPGGPFWARKDHGAWSIPKGLIDADEDDLAAARREFTEETSLPVPDGTVHDLGEVRLASRKVVIAFAVEGDVDIEAAVSNTFEMPWPPRSGRSETFPEIDRMLWCGPEEAVDKLNPAQGLLVARLREILRLPPC